MTCPELGASDEDAGEEGEDVAEEVPSLTREPSGAIPHALNYNSHDTTQAGMEEHSLDDLLPVALWLELKVVVAPEISIELRLGDELEEVGVEPHLRDVRLYL